MKKYILTVFAFVAAIALVFTTFGNTYAEEFEEEGHHAAPAVAGLLLEEAGIDNRYGTGKDGGNYISDVARNMAPDTDFNGVKKEDVIAYSCAVASFLNEKGAEVTSPYSNVFDPISSGATATDNEDGTVTLAITVKDLCGDGMSELNPLSDFYVTDSVITGTFYFGTSSIPGSTVWSEDDGVYTVTLARNYFNARPAVYENGWYRIWDIYVLNEMVEDNLILKTTYYAVGDWKMDLYVGATLNPRFIEITSHVGGEIIGFFGVGYDPNGVPTGDIEGTIDGQTINMHYSRTSGYTADFDGTINANGNSMSGVWSDYARTNESWDMVRQ